MQIGLSTCGKTIDGALFQAYREAGITMMEISTNAAKYPEIDYSRLGTLSREQGITLWSFHLPFEPFEEIDLSRPELADYTLAYFETLIQKAAAIGIQVFVVHPSGEPIPEATRADRLACAKENLRKLADIGANYGAVIAVENLPRTCLGRDSSDMLELLSAHPALKACFDTNHLLAEPPEDFLRKIGKHLVTTHVSDYDFLNERHWLPGEGKLNWQSILSVLREVGYEGPWLYEISFTAPASIHRPRDLNCEDFAQNARELFSGDPLTVTGTPAEGLTGWRK